jgi:hypothetical protein
LTAEAKRRSPQTTHFHDAGRAVGEAVGRGIVVRLSS